MTDVAVERVVTIVPAGIHPSVQRLLVVPPVVIERNTIFADNPAIVIVDHVGLFDGEKGKRFEQSTSPMKTFGTGRRRCGNERSARILVGGPRSSLAEMRITRVAVAFDDGCAGEEARGGAPPEVSIVHSETGLAMRSQCAEGSCAKRLGAQTITVHDP